MTEVVQVALIASVAPTVAAVASLMVSLHNGKKADENSRKADTIIGKTDVIHALANDNLSKATNALAVSNETIHGLQTLLAASKDKS